MTNKEENIVKQCKKILKSKFVNIDSLIFEIEKDEFNYFVYVNNKKELIFEISDIIVNKHGTILQYCISIH